MVAGCSGSDEPESESMLTRVRRQGYINVGFAGEAPYSYMVEGDLTGEDPAVHREIWKTLGVNDVRGVQADFALLIPELNAHRFDVIAAGMFVRPQRCEVAAFSEPIYCAPAAFLVPKGNPKQISTYESVATSGVALGVLTGAAEAAQAKEVGVSVGKIVELATPTEGLAALEAGRVGAFGLTSISLRNLLKDKPTANVELTQPFTPVVGGKEQMGCGAAVFRKDDPQALKAFNAELAKLKKSGRLLELIQPFGFGPETIPPDDVTEKLCQA
jgi:polar amino acid transport system substrate-binding protein